VKLPTTRYQLPTNLGFTLIEILVTIFIFAIAFTATSFILTTNLRSANAIHNNFVASGLAQEGMEIVRNLRDKDWFFGLAFGTTIPDGSYLVQWDSNALIPIGSNPNLNKGALGGYSYDPGTPSIFKRSIDISTVISGVEKKIVVNMTWIERGGTVKSLSAEEHLFNWK